jgi:hypothetical protein
VWTAADLVRRARGARPAVGTLIPQEAEVAQEISFVLQRIETLSAAMPSSRRRPTVTNMTSIPTASPHQLGHR